MTTRRTRPAAVGLAALALVCAGLVTPVAAEESPQRDPGLGLGYGEHVPSAWEMRQGRHKYQSGNFTAAFWHYMNAAVWADKFAQYNIGVMYLRGEGVEFDAVRGWAWLELAAERGYPDMVQAADQLYELLDAEQRAEGERILREELLPDYGDATRVPATARRMERELRKATGSRTGSQAMLSFLRVYDGSGISRRGDEYYAAAKWDFERIVRFETQLMKDLANAGATLGEFRILEDEMDDAPEPREDPEDGSER